MSVDDLITQTTTILNELTIGERFWFWMCPEIDAGQPAFLVQTLAADPAMAALRAQTGQLTIPVGVSPVIGMGSIQPDGRLSMGSPLLAEKHLDGLARWVKITVGDHEALARLKGATLLNISAQGVIRQRFSSPMLWEGVPDVIAPGTLEQTAARLSRLKTGQGYWFWMAQHGPADAPFLYLHPARRDPQGKAFSSRILALRRRAAESGVELKGLAQRTQAGTLLLVSADKIEPGKAILDALCATCPALEEPLSTAVLLQSEGDRFVQAVLNESEEPEEAVDLSAQVAILATLSEPGSKGAFWMGSTGGSTTLMLATSPAALKSAVATLDTSGKSTRGTVVLSPRGWLEFRTRKPYPGFITALASWARAHRAQWPVLARLNGARMTHRAADGEIIDRQRDDAAWTAT